MIQFYSPPKLVKRLAFLFLLLVGISQISSAQAPTISYPTAAQNLSRGIGDSLLTVKLVFNGVCTGTVRLGLPASVTYVAGTVTKTSGTAGVTIAELSIADLSKPTFSISGVAAIGDEITFTVARRAGCGSLATAKDSVYFVAGAGCSDGSEIAGTVNTYNLFAPALSITPPAALTGAVIGTTASRTTVITNGGNGATDTVRFYVVYPSAGIVNTSGTNAITANGVSFTPSSTNGDTLFYEIFGATLFGGNNLLTSGETVTIVEPIRVEKCNTTTTYAASWGRNEVIICQTASATSAMTMAVGVAIPAISYTTVTPQGACTDGVYDVLFINNGSGGKAGAMYNLNLLLASQRPAGSSEFQWFTLSNPRIGSTSLISTDSIRSGFFAKNLDLSQLSSDPDGVGVGLDDLDGDGEFDDLAPGNSVIVRVNRTFSASPNCNEHYFLYLRGFMWYNSMCSPSIIGYDAPNIGEYNINYAELTTLVPPLINDGVPFTIRICDNYPYSGGSLAGATTDSMELVLTLPAGLAYAGANSFSSGAGTGTFDNVTTSGSTLILYKKGWHQQKCMTIDLVYTCAPGASSSTITIPYEFQLVQDRSCGAITRLKCDNISTEAQCSGVPCTVDGPGLGAMTIRRTTLGWTDNTLSTKISASSMSTDSRKTVLPLDTFNVQGAAVIKAPVAGHNNLYFEYRLDKVSGQNVVYFAGGTLGFKASGSSVLTSCSLPAATYTASTASLEVLTLDLSPLLGTCLPSALFSGDSVFLNANFSVSNAPDSLNASLYGTTLKYAPNSRMSFYNLDALGNKLVCQYQIPDLLFLGFTYNKPVVHLGRN